MNNIIKFIVKNLQKKTRIDYYLSQIYKDLSRNKIKNLIQKNFLKINGTIITDPSKKILNGDEISLEIEEDKEVSLKPFNYELSIVFEDKDLNIINAQRIISNIRLHKDNHDVENLQKAINIAETTLANTINYVEIGKSEIEIKNFLLQQLYENGAEGIAFDPIVLAGSNSALPHGHSSNDYFLKDGDCLLFDFGAVVNGYNSDITRTFFVGSASDEQKNFYDAVLKANKLGLSISKPNLTMHNLDDSVLNSLEDSGYKDYIVHKTGHGLGLDVHEDPYIMRKNNELLEEGMVITIEPGLYKQGDLGVRIEDDVLITNDGCKSLTTFSKELRII